MMPKTSEYEHGVELMPDGLRHSLCLACVSKHVSLVVPTRICGLDAP
jgi:hypothetical protein